MWAIPTGLDLYIEIKLIHTVGVNLVLVKY